MIEVGLVLPDDLAEMRLIEDEEEVQAYAPQTAQESLANGVGLGCLIGSGQDIDIGSLSESVEGIAKLVVVVADEKAWSLAKGSCLAQLLGDPGVVGTSGHAEMEQATRTQFDDNKDKDGAEEQVIGLEKVNSPDVLGMVAKKCGPRLLGRNGGAHLVDVPPNRTFGHSDTELEQFSPDACAPCGVVESS